MTDAANDASITQVGTVFVPVRDQERALEFYLGKLGFEKRADFSYGDGGRWIEVAPSGSVIALALVPPSEGRAPGGDAAHCAFAADDIETAHATLRARDVEVDEVIGRSGTSRPGLVAVDVTVADPVPPQFSFRDSEGNRFLIVQPG